MNREWNHNIHYHALVLSAMPLHSRLAVDVGCGEGQLAAQLAKQSDHAIGIDLDADVLESAREKQASQSNLEFIQGDFMTHPFSAESVDFIAAVATLHHLPLQEALTRAGMLLRTGGVLVVVGLYRPATWQDHLFAVLGLAASRMVRLLYTWADIHAPLHAPVESLSEIQKIMTAVLPGAVLQRQLFFRYSMIWRKP